MRNFPLKISAFLATIFFLSGNLALAKKNFDSFDYKNLSLNGGSFVYHMHNPKDSKYTQYFDNQYFSLGYQFSQKSEIIAGTFKNSFVTAAPFSELLTIGRI